MCGKLRRIQSNQRAPPFEWRQIDWALTLSLNGCPAVDGSQQPTPHELQPSARCPQTEVSLLAPPGHWPWAPTWLARHRKLGDVGAWRETTVGRSCPPGVETTRWGATYEHVPGHPRLPWPAADVPEARTRQPRARPSLASCKWNLCTERCSLLIPHPRYGSMRQDDLRPSSRSLERHPAPLDRLVPCGLTIAPPS